MLRLFPFPALPKLSDTLPTPPPRHPRRKEDATAGRCPPQADTHPFDPLVNVQWPVPEGVVPVMSAKAPLPATLFSPLPLSSHCLSPALRFSSPPSSSPPVLHAAALTAA